VDAFILAGNGNAVAGYLPASEADLYRSRPGSNRPGAFPPTSLLGAEKVIYEARPRLLALHPILIIAPMPFILLLLLVGIVGVAEGLPGIAFALGAIGFFVFLLLIPVLYAVYSWNRSAYALTDQRVLAAHGDSYDSAPYDQVENVALAPGSSKIVFQLVPLPGMLPAQARKRVLVWAAVPGAPGVAAYAKSAARFYSLRLRQRQLRQDLVASSMVHRIVCEYCGGLIDVTTISSDSPKCPRCSAPIRVAPILQ